MNHASRDTTNSIFHAALPVYAPSLSDPQNVEGLSKAARAAMMEEGIAINESLRMLKSVFRILGEANKPLAKGQKAEIVQYRGNTLTEVRYTRGNRRPPGW